MKKLLLIILYCLIYSLSYAADYNWAHDSLTTSVIDYGFQTPGTGGLTGGATEILDENDSTLAYYNVAGAGALTYARGWFRIVITFPTAHTITQVKGIFSGTGLSNGQSDGPFIWTMGYYDGSWHYFDAHDKADVWFGVLTGEVYTKATLTTKNYTGLSYANVTKVMLACTSAWGGSPKIGTYARANLYSLDVYGPTGGSYAFIMD